MMLMHVSGPVMPFITTVVPSLILLPIITAPIRWRLLLPKKSVKTLRLTGKKPGRYYGPLMHVYGCLIGDIGPNIRIIWGIAVCMSLPECGPSIVPSIVKWPTLFKPIRPPVMSIRKFLISLFVPTAWKKKGMPPLLRPTGCLTHGASIM